MIRLDFIGLKKSIFSNDSIRMRHINKEINSI